MKAYGNHFQIVDNQKNCQLHMTTMLHLFSNNNKDMKMTYAQSDVICKDLERNITIRLWSSFFTNCVILLAIWKMGLRKEGT
jgi:hypothetical protein